MYNITDGKGTLAEIKFASALIGKGYTVSFPFASKASYDCLFDDGNGIYRVQVKYGSVKGNGKKSRIQFHTCTFRRNLGKNISVCHKGEVDFYGVYVEYIDKCFLIPSIIINERQMSLRLYYIDGQCRHLAKDYEI